MGATQSTEGSNSTLAYPGQTLQNDERKTHSNSHGLAAAGETPALPRNIPSPLGSVLLTGDRRKSLIDALQAELRRAGQSITQKYRSRRRGFVLQVTFGDDDVVLYEAAAGTLSDAPASPPMKIDSLFEIASCTKLIVAACLLHLIHQGRESVPEYSGSTAASDSFRLPVRRELPSKMSLQSRLCDLVDFSSPECPFARLLVSPSGKDWTPYVTLSNLLSHTSGIADYWKPSERGANRQNAWLAKFIADPNRVWKADEILKHIRDLPRDPRVSETLRRLEQEQKTWVHAPSFRYNYSDTNYVVIARLMEMLTGCALEEIIQFHTQRLALPSMIMSYSALVSQPRGSEATVAKAPEQSEEAKRMAVTHPPTSSWARVPSMTSPLLLPLCAHRYEGSEDLFNVPRQSADWGGGGLISNVTDMAKMMRAIFVKPYYDAVLSRPSTHSRLNFFESLQPVLELLERIEPTGDEDVYYAHGLFIIDADSDDDNEKSARLFGHEGHGNSFMYTWLAAGITFVGSTNTTSGNWFEDVVYDLTLAIRRVFRRFGIRM